MLLQAIEQETGSQPTAAVIWLHGLGADGHDFEFLAPQLMGTSPRAWRFVFPHATERAVTINGGARMRAWYDIFGFQRTAREDEEGFRESDAGIRQLIEDQIERGVPADRIVLAGFSQGGAVSLYTALRYTERLAGVVALSTYLPLADRLEAEQAAANRGLPIFMAHGLNDTVLPPALGLESREILRGLGFPVEWHQYPMPHSVCDAEIFDLREYLFRVLPER